MMTDQKLQKS